MAFAGNYGGGNRGGGFGNHANTDKLDDPV
jgi:hypothetical protein